MSDPDPILDATNDPPSTDTDAIQNLITALRASLTSTQTLLASQATRLTHLGDIETELAKLKDEHLFVSAAKEAVDAKLKEEIKRREVAEETVEAMRGQVEAARRGVMVLQKQDKERKRMSTLGGLGLGGVGEEEEVLKDLAAAAADTSATATTKDKSSKRQSILKAHRRISSQSEPDAIYASPTTMISPAQIATPVMPVIPQQPGRPGLREFKLGAGASITGASMTTTMSTSPRPSSSQQDEQFLTSPKPDTLNMSTSSSFAPSNPDESIRLRGEINTLQQQLAEAEEAREASETCLKALREFIASSPGGGGTDTVDQQLDLTSADLVGIRLPPLPTDKDPDEPPTPPAKEEKKLGAAGWGLGKLWKGQSAGQPVASPRSTIAEPSTPGLLSPGTSIRSLPPRSSSPTSTISQLPGQQEPTEDKLNAVAGGSTPLSNFVASWTKTVAPGTPAAVTPAQGSGASETRPAPAARGFSGFWGRKKEDVKGKDLPETPETGTFSNRDEHDQMTTYGNEDGQTGLEPSPFIVDEQAGSTSLFEADDHDHKSQSGDTKAGVEEAETGATTPKQWDRDSKELVPVELGGDDIERTASNEEKKETN